MRPARRLGWEIRSVKVFFSICAGMALMAIYIAGIVSTTSQRPGDGLSDTLVLHCAARCLYPCLYTLGMVVNRVPLVHGVSSRIFFPDRSSASLASPWSSVCRVGKWPHTASKEGGDADSVCLPAGHQMAVREARQQTGRPRASAAKGDAQSPCQRQSRRKKGRANTAR